MRGMVYAVCMSNGSTKIGYTKSVSSRIPGIVHSAKVMGVSVDRVILSPSIDNPRGVESELLSYCDARWKTVGKEYFEGMSRDDAILAFKDVGVSYFEFTDVKRKVVNKKQTWTATVFDDEMNMGSVSKSEDIADKLTDHVIRLAELGMTSGVICNRIRYAGKSDVMGVIDGLVDCGTLIEVVTPHVRTGVPVKRYVLRY